MRVRLFQSLLAITAVSLSGTASAHFHLLDPAPSSNSTNGGKGSPPCGPDASSDVITPATGGSVITLRVNETVPHPGHYRVALALNSRDELDPAKGGLKEPVVKNADGMVLTPITGPGSSDSAEIQNPPVFPVLADGIFPHTEGGGMFMTSITLPNVNCERCTLQVIEFMAEHAPDYFYRHCADLKITADPGKPLFEPSGSGGMGGSGGASGGSGGASGGSGGASGGSAGGSPTTAGSGGVAPTAGSASAGTPGGGGSPGGGGAAGSGTAGTGASSVPTAEEEGGCSIAAAPARGGALLPLFGGLLLGLGWFARRRDRA